MGKFKTNKRNTLAAALVLGVVAPLVWAQEGATQIAGIDLAKLVALGVVGATIIGSTADEDAAGNPAETAPIR